MAIREVGMKRAVMWLYAEVDGVKRLPENGLWGVHRLAAPSRQQN